MRKKSQPSKNQPTSPQASESSPQAPLVQDHHNVMTAYISDEKFFNTRAFMIRYQEEEVEINDLCHLRLTVPARQRGRLLAADGSLDEVFMETELVFSDL
jgi:hypothetical protein